MNTRYLYLARHGHADAFGDLTDLGRQQMALLGERLAPVPIDAIWHSPLPRGVAATEAMRGRLPTVPVAPATELVDHVPYVPAPGEAPPSWAGFFDGYEAAEAADGRRRAQALTDRFAIPAEGDDVHEVLITHDYPIAWLVRDALGAPPVRWLGLSSANAALTIIEYRPGAPATMVVYNEMSHLPPQLRWTGFPDTGRP